MGIVLQSSTLYKEIKFSGAESRNINQFSCLIHILLFSRSTEGVKLDKACLDCSVT